MAFDMEPWHLILSHQYDQALAHYNAQLAASPHQTSLDAANRATALLCLGMLPEALAGFEQANDLSVNRRLTGSSYVIKIGAILWLLGENEKAINTFRAAIKGVLDGGIQFADNAGGVAQGLLLWFGGVSKPDRNAKEEALAYLKLLSRQPRIQSWPGPVAQLILGQKASPEVIAAASGTPELSQAIFAVKSDLLKRRRLTNALFYMAIAERDRGCEPRCRTLLNYCATLENPILEVEWYLARGELGLPIYDQPTKAGD